MTIFFGDGTNQTSAAGASKLLQTVQSSTTTQYDFSSSSYSNTDLDAAITPSSSSNKILVKCALCTRAYATNSTSLGVRLLRGSTNVYTNNEYHWHAVNAAINLFYQSYFEFLDSPNTTSSTTYTIAGARYRTSNGTQLASINPVSGQTSFIILQEVVV
tara:strand:+ start:40 stop:516 length:477 start_codon:yes stop_codon:yes gene_type:complete